MALNAVYFSFYDDKWFDGFGIGVPETDLPADGVQEITPRCEPGLAPCFGAFTPVAMELRGETFFGPPNLFLVSSRGGLLKFPSANGLQTIDFSGTLWERITWIQVGFYIPAACGDLVPPEDLNCSLNQEKALTVESLTFRPIPEPAALGLLAVGLIGLIRHRRAAARQY